MGRPKKIHVISQDDDVPAVVKTYSKETTDFDQVALFNQLFANIFDRNRDKSIGQVLDYIVENGGYALSNKELMELTNKLGMRADMRTPSPSENKPPEE